MLRLLMIDNLNPCFLEIPKDIFDLTGRAVIDLIDISHPIPEMKDKISAIIQIGLLNIFI